MRNAFLIQCHRDPDLINNLIDSLSDDNTDFYLHVDKKPSIIDDLIKRNNVYLVEKRIAVNWGTYSQIEATLELLKVAIKKDYDYLSLISGQDYPIFSNSKFYDFLMNSNHSEFIEYSELLNENWSYEGGIGRIKYYWLDFLTPKKNIIFRIIRNIYLKTLGKFFSKDIGFLGQLYGGSQWFTITGNFALYIIDFLKQNPNYLNVFKNTVCSDEIFFQTLIMNSHFKDKVVNDNLRFIKWNDGESSPKILTIEDKTEILNSNKFFMRKVDSTISKDLISQFPKK